MYPGRDTSQTASEYTSTASPLVMAACSLPNVRMKQTSRYHVLPISKSGKQTHLSRQCWRMCGDRKFTPPIHLHDMQSDNFTLALFYPQAFTKASNVPKSWSLISCLTYTESLFYLTSVVCHFLPRLSVCGRSVQRAKRNWHPIAVR
jgi:hypothetical protein